MLVKNTIRQIRKSLGRFLAIFAIVALGVGFFVGLRVSKDAMIKTGSQYFEELRFFDFRLVSTLGLTESDVEAVRKLAFTDTVSGSVSADVIIGQESGANGVLHMHTILNDINVPDLRYGRMPQNANECVVDSKYFSKDMIGKYITLSKENSEKTFETFAYDRYEVVGIVDSPSYVYFERGSSSLGSVAGYAYILEDGFTTDYYTEIYLRLKEHPPIYSDAYDTYAKECEKELTKVLDTQAVLRFETLKDEAMAKIEDAKKELSDNQKEYASKKKEVEDELLKAREEIINGENELKDAKTKLQVAKDRLEDGRLLLLTSKKQYEEALKEFEDNKAYLPPAVVAQTETKLKATYEELLEQENILALSEQEYMQGEAAYKENEAKLKEAKETLEKQTKEAEDSFLEAEDKLKEASGKITEALEEVADMKEANTFVLGRSTNVGYVSLENDTQIVAGVSRVFPLFFFIVASLVCITTMTRMVDEQRVENGTLKALGYGDFAIAAQYLVYAGSASLAGCIIGFLAGSKVLPFVLWKVYHIMYSIERPIVYLLDFKLFFFCSIIFMAATLGSTWFAVAGDLREVAAELIRPKAPTAGKRILLERIGFIWNRIKFLHKVSIRNILRYKKRMFMMMIGVGGCTALLLTGYGIRDSIQPILDYQFQEIHLYDMVVSFLDPKDEKARETFLEDYKDVIGEISFVNMQTVDLLTNGSADSLSLVVADKLSDTMVNLHNKDTVYEWPKKDETIIDYRLATANDIQIGDTIELRDSDYHVLTLKVVGIFDNYLRDYAYISTETFTSQLGSDPQINTAYINVSDNNKPKEAASKILNDETVTSVNVTESQIELVGNMLSSLDYIVLIVLVAAGALAFIVIYNLTNISINERIREIATIKVLGFYETEAAAYVFRENLVLTIISSLVGLPMGIWLHRFVMQQIKIKSMYFGHRILPMSFVWSVVLTFIFAVLVDIVMYLRLKKINMAESLKAID